jgi:hypothetical protein
MQANVIKYTLIEDETKPYVNYHISCTKGVYRWEVTHRFSDFEKLEKDLSSRKHNGKLPPKIYFGNLSVSQIEKRMKSLQAYLDALLSDITILDDEHLDKFLEIKRHTQIKRTGIVTANADFVQAVFQHDAKDETELSFRKGDQIIVHQREGNWWYGELRQDKTTRGYFLSNYVHTMVSFTEFPILEEPPIRVVKTYEQAQKSKNLPVGKVMQLRFEYLADDGLVLGENAHVRIIEPIGNDFMSGCTYVKPFNSSATKFWIPDEYLIELATYYDVC